MELITGIRITSSTQPTEQWVLNAQAREIARMEGEAEYFQEGESNHAGSTGR